MKRIKEILGYVVLPLTLLMGAIYALLQQNNSLKTQLKRKEVEEKINETLEDLEKAEQDADTKEANYRRLLDEYRKSGPGSDEV